MIKLFIVCVFCSCCTCFVVNGVVPVVYILFGEIPTFLLINIELASRNNPVYVINDIRNDSGSFGANVKFLPMKPYMHTAEIFRRSYVHMSRDTSRKRFRYELNCIQRWFILAEFMKERNIRDVFFGDGDSSIFVNITEIIGIRRYFCDAVINVDAQLNNMYWVGAGEASFWTINAIRDFTDFTSIMYKQKLSILKVKRYNVVDMSILWLWWVRHHKTADVGWETGRPYSVRLKYHPTANGSLEVARAVADEAFKFAAKLDIPTSPKRLKICNGLDVLNRTVFDHMQAWSAGRNFSLNLNGNGVPFVIGASLNHGGRPESLDPEALTKLENNRLYLNNIHYQVCANKYLRINDDYM